MFDAERQIRGPEPIGALGLSVSGIQAALRWGHDSTFDTYFFKSGSYWRFSPHLNRVEAAYPRSMQDWSGVPNDVDASFRDVYGTKRPLRSRVSRPHRSLRVNLSCSSFRLRPLHPRTTVLEIRSSRHELAGGLPSLRRRGFFCLQKRVSEGQKHLFTTSFFFSPLFCIEEENPGSDFLEPRKRRFKVHPYSHTRSSVSASSQER